MEIKDNFLERTMHLEERVVKKGKENNITRIKLILIRFCL